MLVKCSLLKKVRSNKIAHKFPDREMKCKQYGMRKKRFQPDMYCVVSVGVFCSGTNRFAGKETEGNEMYQPCSFIGQVESIQFFFDLVLL